MVHSASVLAFQPRFGAARPYLSYDKSFLLSHSPMFIGYCAMFFVVFATHCLSLFRSTVLHCFSRFSRFSVVFQPEDITRLAQLSSKCRCTHLLFVSPGFIPPRSIRVTGVFTPTSKDKFIITILINSGKK